MFLGLIFIVAGQVSYENKEETCFFLTNSAQKLRYLEIENHLKENRQLDRQKTVMKLFEDSFDLCLANIKDSEVEKIGLKRIRDFQPYLHLFTTDFSKYTKNEDLKLSEGYLERRARITQRLSKGSTLSQDL